MNMDLGEIKVSWLYFDLEIFPGYSNRIAQSIPGRNGRFRKRDGVRRAILGPDNPQLGTSLVEGISVYTWIICQSF